MGLQDYISESEAASRAGVSPKTLQRFAEAGYLHVEVEPDGLRLYSPAELDEIFASHQRPPFPATEEEEGSPRSSSTQVEEGESSATVNETRSEIPYVQPTGPIEQSIVESSPFSEGTVASSPDPTGAELLLNPLPEDADELREELLRIRELLRNRDALLSLKEEEVRDLRGQRDWLKTRVERLEEKGDRDQILLLSETQTIRKLISIQEQKRSPVRNFLEWMGILPPTPSPMPVISSRASVANSDKTDESKARSLEMQKVSVGQ